MDIDAVRQQIEAYRAGRCTAEDLAAALATGVAEAPHQAASFRALIAAYAQGGALPRAVADELLSSLGEVAPAPATSTATSGDDAATRYNRPAPAAGETQGDSQPAPTTGATGPAAGTGPVATTGGSAWDVAERLDEPSVPLAVGSVLNRRYELVAELGRGGMGVVFKALDRINAELKDRNPYVAIKALGDDFKRHPLAMRSLQRETRKAQKLAHPNIVTVHDFDRDGGNVFMVMELLEGKPLDEYLRSEASLGLPYERVGQFVRQIGAALTYAHDQGIVHSDFKPGNAFITRNDVIKVVDFGIARAVQTRDGGGERTMFDVSELNAMSPAYASLEMLAGDPPDPRDDLYALACVTYELLTGHHPFKGIDAKKARDAKIEPGVPRGLPRPAWLALRQALAFERAERTASVAAFVDGFLAKPRSRAWIVPTAVAASLLVAVAVIGPGQWRAHRATVLVESLAASSPEAFEPLYQQLAALPAGDRGRALQDEATRKTLIERVRRDVEALVTPPGLDFNRARQRVAAIAVLMPDSSAVADMNQRLEQASRVELLKQIELRDAALEHGWLLPAPDHDSVTTVLDRIRRIDPANHALLDPRLPGAYSAAAKVELDGGRTDSAKALVDAGLRFATTDPRLLDLKDRLEIEITRGANLRRAGEVEARLAKIDVAAPDFVETLLSQRDDLLLLLSVNAAAPVARHLQEALDAQVGKRLRQRLATNDFAGAQELLLDVGDLLPDTSVVTLRAQLADAGRQQEARAEETLGRLRRAVLSGRVSTTGGSGALDLYAELQRGGASPDVLATARDLVAYGYLREARRARMAGDVGGAGKKLAAGVALHPGKSVARMIEGEQQVLASPGRPVEDLNSARERFATQLAAPVLGPSELASVAESLDRLESLGTSAQEVASGLRQVESRVQAEVQRRQKESPEQAQVYLRQAMTLLPGSEGLGDPARIRTATPPPVVVADASVPRAALAQLIAKPEPSGRWAADVHRALQRLASIAGPADAGIVDARTRAVAVFVQAAGRARAEKRFSEADNLLLLARQIDPQAQELVAERGAVQRDRTASEAAVATQDQQANLEAVKQRLTDQAAAGDVAGAQQTAAALKRVLAGSVYVARDVPQALITAYARRARIQVAAGEVDVALKTLADGRQKFGASAELKALELRYVAVGEEFDRLSAAVSASIGDHRQHLEAIRAAGEAEYPVIERMLAQTLADRIADQRAAGRLPVANGLLDAGRKIFPEFGALLEQGVAGRLHNAPISVAE